jgi:hypothetical protein
MRKPVVFVGLVCVTAMAFFQACDDTTADSDGGADSSTPPPSGDGGGDGAVSPGKTQIRVVHASTDAPAVDVCVKPSGGAAVGPVLNSLGRQSGLAYGEATQYVELAAGSYELLVVAAGAADCTSPVVSLPAVELPEQSRVTAIAWGSLNATPRDFDVRLFLDDGAVSAGKTKLRVVHASLNTPNVDVGVGAGVMTTPLFSNLLTGSIPTLSNRLRPTGAPDAVNANGFIELDPTSGIEVSVKEVGFRNDALSLKPVTLAAGKITDVFAIGNADGKELKALVCDTLAAPQNGLSVCAVTGAAPTDRVNFRLAHLVSDRTSTSVANGHGIDVCLAPTGSSTFLGPVLKLRGGHNGVRFGQVTTTLPILPGTYDVRIIKPTSDKTEPSCATASDQFPGISATMGVALNGTTTLVLRGNVDLDGGVAPARWLPLADEGRPDGGARLRFVNAAPFEPVPLGLEIGVPEAFDEAFSDVEYDAGITPPGSTGVGAASLGASAASDAGFITLNAFEADGGRKIRIRTATVDVRAPSGSAGAALPANSVSTVFATQRRLSDGGAEDIRALVCNYGASVSSGILACTGP